jgi:hypothetical protein
VTDCIRENATECSGNSSCGEENGKALALNLTRIPQCNVVRHAGEKSSFGQSESDAGAAKISNDEANGTTKDLT